MYTKRAYILQLSLFCLLAIFAGCSKDPDTRANVMFVNGCAGTNSIYAWANKTKVTGAVNIYYTTSSNYQKIPSGRINVNYYYSVNGNPLCNGNVLFNTGDHYTLFAGGTATTPTFVVTTDDITLPAAGNARIRFVNLSSDVATADFMVGTQTMGSGIINGECSPFYDVAAGTYFMKVADSSGNVSDSVKLDAGLLYTAMLTGTRAATTGNVLTLSLVTNR